MPPPTNTNNIEDDNISTLEDSASHPSSINPNPTKRSRHTTETPSTTHINLSVQLGFPIEETFKSVYAELDKTNIPRTAISREIRSCAHTHYQLIDQKIIQLTITQPQYSTTIYEALQAISGPENSITLTNQTLPPDLPRDIDTTPHDHNISPFPRHCQIRSCYAHNNAQPIYPTTNLGMELAQTHAQQLHSAALFKIPTTTLHNMGWHTCCNDCELLFLDENYAANHRRRCPSYQQLQHNHTNPSGQSTISPSAQSYTSRTTTRSNHNATTPKDKDD
jgi:hypothetical protein